MAFSFTSSDAMHEMESQVLEQTVTIPDVQMQPKTKEKPPAAPAAPEEETPSVLTAQAAGGPSARDRLNIRMQALKDARSKGPKEPKPLVIAPVQPVVVPKPGPVPKPALNRRRKVVRSPTRI